MMSRNDNLPTTEIDVLQAKNILMDLLKTNIVPFLWGPPGIGKSTIVRDLAAENGWELIDLRLSLLSPVDLRGLPVVDKVNKKADWYKPAFLPKPGSKKKGILFLDEINLAPHSVQAAAYQLILDKRLGEYIFPENWRIIAAGNREGVDKANVFKMSAPLANRFVHFTVRDDWKVWRDWAKGAKIRPEVMDFIALNDSLFLKMSDKNEKAFPSPRSWHFVSDLLNAFNYQNGEIPDENLKGVITGAVGEGAGREFASYLADYDLKNINTMVAKFYETGKIKLPKEQNKRFAIIKKVFGDYKKREINNATFMKFEPHLTAEEKETVKAIQEDERKKGELDKDKRFGF